MPPRSEPVVVALMWTYNRIDVARACLSAIRAQVLLPHRIIVVDSASPDGTANVLAAENSDLEVVALGENEGMGAAIAEGLDVAEDLNPDYVWFVEDDSSPAPMVLSELVAFLETHDEYSVVGSKGALLRGGRWKWSTPNAAGPCDFCMLDGSLLRRTAIADVDVPRRDFFIMHVDVEYPLRVMYAGHRAYQLGHTRHGALQLGSAATDINWRRYYQTRNHLRMAIDHRSFSLLWGFMVRTGAQCFLEFRPSGPGLPAVRLRFRGIADALRGRMGRRLEPPSTFG